MEANDGWLAQVSEAAIEPDLPICDAHHHLWTAREGAGRYLLEELVTDIDASGHNVVSTVYIEVRSMHRDFGPRHLRPIGELEFANGIAAMSASGMYGKARVAAGIVGNADMRRGEAAGEVLDLMVAMAPHRFRGIRHVSAWDADATVRGHRKTPPGLLLDAGFRAGVRELGKRDLTFDAWCFHPQLGDMAEFIRAVPETTIILNHVGGPLGVGAYEGKRGEIFPEWKRGMAEIAELPNVVVKLGGFFLGVSGYGWEKRPTPPTSNELAQAARPYADFVIETFGVDRCFFESNFPVERTSASYGVLWNAFKKIARGASPAEKAKLFHENAARVYRLAV
jgi:L-fuconolactonase